MYVYIVTLITKISRSVTVHGYAKLTDGDEGMLTSWSTYNIAIKVPLIYHPAAASISPNDSEGASFIQQFWMGSHNSHPKRKSYTILVYI